MPLEEYKSLASLLQNSPPLSDLMHLTTESNCVWTRERKVLMTDKVELLWEMS